MSDLDDLINQGKALLGTELGSPTFAVWRDDVRAVVAPYGDRMQKVAESALRHGAVIMNSRNTNDKVINRTIELLELLKKRKPERSSITAERADTQGRPVNTGTLDSLHPLVQQKCSQLYRGEHYAEAVEKGFKIVRDRLRKLTNHETGSEAFGKGGLYVKGATAEHVDNDFQQAVKFLTMAIDMFRNEKSHTSDGNIGSPVRAYEYLALTSLAIHLLDDAEVKQAPHSRHEENKKAHERASAAETSGTTVKLDEFQILAMRAYGKMRGAKELLISYPSGGGGMIFPLGDLTDEGILNDLKAADVQELEASLEELAGWGIVTLRYNSNMSPIFKLAKAGYVVLKEYPILTGESR